MKAEQASVQKAVADANAEVGAATGKINGGKGAIEQTKKEIDAGKGQITAKTAAATAVGQNATVVKDALAAALAHEKALAAVDAAQTAAQQTMQELAAKTKAAGDKAGNDGSVKNAVGRTATTKQNQDAARDAEKRSLAEASQMVKELVDASRGTIRRPTRRTPSLLAVQKDVADKQKSAPTTRDEIQGRSDAPRQGRRKEEGSRSAA